ncbi:hypothetical protein [Streptomyces sp. NPDC020747]|uniref:hypothetical protein n=1 Tax=Streptomyces sp. NPDC020747 TaxID=3365086 RepID=UPI00378D397D
MPQQETASRWTEPQYEQTQIESPSSDGSVNIIINGPVSHTNWAFNNRDVTQTLTQDDFKNEIEEAASKFREELTADRDEFLRTTFPGGRQQKGTSATVIESVAQRMAPTEQQVKAIYQGVRSAVTTLQSELPEMQLGSRAKEEISRTIVAINDELGRTFRDRARVGAGLDSIIAVLHESRYPEDSSVGERASAAAERLKSARLQLDTLDVASGSLHDRDLSGFVR